MKKLLRFLIPALLAIFCIASVGWYLLDYDREFTRDILLQEARKADRNGHTIISAWFYNAAYSHSGNDESVAIELANQYRADKNYTKAEVTLSNAISSQPSAELYAALSSVYVEQDKLMDAVALLAGISDETIRQQVEQMRPSAPTATPASGFYSQYISVALATSSGTLYYSTDGEYPSVNEDRYDGPITLSAGETVIRAISVGDNGLVSPISILGYTVGGVVEPAVFQDSNMEYAVRTALGVSGSQTIYTNELWSITEFTVPESVQSLEDLSLLTHLESLTIQNRSLSSLTELSCLTSLTSLDLSGCRFPVEELAVIAKLPSLAKLNLSDCGLSSIAALSGANGLTYLNLNSNMLRNLDVLSEMDQLRELYINHNAVTTLDAILSLYNLEKLDLSYNSVSSLAQLGVCTRLTWLDVSNNQLASLNGITSLPLLTSLAADYNSLSDISALGACADLTELTLSNNSISDISCLAVLTKLEILDFSYNSVSALPSWTTGALRIIDGSHNSLTDISALSVMSGLTYVSFEYNNITNIDALAACNNLVQVNVYGNSIESVSALTEHNIIVNYNPIA